MSCRCVLHTFDYLNVGFSFPLSAQPQRFPRMHTCWEFQMNRCAHITQLIQQPLCEAQRRTTAHLRTRCIFSHGTHTQNLPTGDNTRHNYISHIGTGVLVRSTSKPQAPVWGVVFGGMCREFDASCVAVLKRACAASQRRQEFS